MIRLALTFCLAFGAEATIADSLVAARMIRPGDVLSDEDLVRSEIAHPGTISSRLDAVGLEARVTLFAGRPIRPGDLGLPRLVRRNEIVPLVYRRGAIDIRTEGRSLSDGAAGDLVHVMNLDSRSRLSGTVSPRGEVIVSGRN